MNDFNLDQLSVIVSQTAPFAHPNCQLTLIEALPLDQNPAAVYLAKLKKSSRRPQKCALDAIAKILSNGMASCFELDWSRVRYQHTALVRSQLMDGYAPATANRFLCALRGTLEEAWLLGQMSAEDYHRAAHLSPIIGETLPAGRELSASEICSLLQNCMDDPRLIGTRDAAVIAIMYSGGLRREEVTKLDLEDYDETNRKLLIHGERSKERAVYLADGAVVALNDWLKIRGNDLGPVFLEVNKGGNLIDGKRIST